MTKLVLFIIQASIFHKHDILIIASRAIGARSYIFIFRPKPENNVTFVMCNINKRKDACERSQEKNLTWKRPEEIIVKLRRVRKLGKDRQ